MNDQSHSHKFDYVVMDPRQFSELPSAITLNEAAERLKHRVRWVKKQLRDRQIPILKVGFKMLIPEAHMVMFYVIGSAKQPQSSKKIH